MLVAVEAYCPDQPDRSYCFDMRPRPGVIARGGPLHHLAGGPLLQVASCFDGNGCEQMLALPILETCQHFVIGKRTSYPLWLRGVFLFDQAGEAEPDNTVAVTFYHGQHFWRFGIDYQGARGAGEWLQQLNADGRVVRKVFYRKIGDKDQQELTLDGQRYDITSTSNELSVSLLKGLQDGGSALALLAGHGLSHECQTAREWLTDQLVFVNSESREASLKQVIDDFPAFRRLCQRLLHQIDSPIVDVRQEESSIQEFFNSHEPSYNRGSVTKWTAADGTPYWLFPRSFLALKVAAGRLVLAKLGFEERPPAEAPPYDEPEADEPEDDGSSPTNLDELFGDSAGDVTEDDPGDLPSEAPATTPHRVPHGALNPEVDLTDDDDLFDLEFDDEDFDFSDLDFEDFDFDDDFSGGGVSDQDRELVYHLPEYNRAMTGGKTVIYRSLGNREPLVREQLKKLVSLMLASGISGQFIFDTDQLEMLGVDLLRGGELWYSPQVRHVDGEPARPPRWERMNDALLMGKDRAVKAMLKMMFTAPEQSYDNDSGGF